MRKRARAFLVGMTRPVDLRGCHSRPPPGPDVTDQSLPHERRSVIIASRGVQLLFTDRTPHRRFGTATISGTRRHSRARRALGHPAALALTACGASHRSGSAAPPPPPTRLQRRASPAAPPRLDHHRHVTNHGAGTHGADDDRLGACGATGQPRCRRGPARRRLGGRRPGDGGDGRLACMRWGPCSPCRTPARVWPSPGGAAPGSRRSCAPTGRRGEPLLPHRSTRSPWPRRPAAGT